MAFSASNFPWVQPVKTSVEAMIMSRNFDVIISVPVVLNSVVF
jgi:hypothetical protein